MSFHRTILVAFTAVFATALTSAAFAGCGGCGFGYAAPVAYAPAPVYTQGCGGCGAALAVTYAQPAPQPVIYMQGGCGGCGGAIAVTYAQPVVAAVPVMPAPIAVDHWDTGGFGGCGCGSCGGCGNALAYAQPVAAPMYVVNQGPEYSGPGLMVPYGTYSPATNLAAPGAYPYIGGRGYGYGYGYRHRHYGRPYYHASYAARPYHYGYGPGRYGPYHRPMGWRG
jgi:hypothetical protein